MKNPLFIHHTLQLGGGEKFIKELVDFSLENGLLPTIVIPNNLKSEYYDGYFKKIGVKVIRFQLYNRKQMLCNFYKSDAYWNLIFRFSLNSRYSSVHFINLGVASIYFDYFKHSKRKFWHVGNAIQYPNYKLPFNKKIFEGSTNELICINEYQKTEIDNQFNVKCKISMFKLFIND